MKKRNLVSIVFALLIIVISATSVFAVSGDSNEVIKGKYHFTAIEDSAIQRENTFEYRDDCFTRSSFSGCKHLEILSIQAAAASITKYGDEKVEYEVDVSESPKNIIEFLEEMKFNDVLANTYYTKEMKENSVGVVVGNKTIIRDGENYTLLAIVPRSAGYKQEWVGDLNLGGGDIHEGFKHARDEILRFIKKYITENSIEGKLKVWISGYSRGAGIANMLGGFFAGGGIEYFGESVSIKPEDIYCYSIGTPKVVKNGLSKNIELSVSGSRDDDDYEYDTPGEAYNYTKGGVLDVNDEMYNGIRNLVASNDYFVFLPPEEFGYTNYGTRINADENLSSSTDYYNELKKISPYIYDLYISDNKQKPFMKKTFDLKSLEIIDTDEESNQVNFIKERLDGVLQLAETNEKYVDKHYQDALSSALGIYGMASPVLKDFKIEDINIMDVIPVFTFSYMDYVSNRLVEEGTVDNIDEAYAVAIKDILEYFLDIEIDLNSYTIDDFLVSLAKYLSENEDEQVMTYGVKALIDRIPEDYAEFLLGALRQFVVDTDEVTLELAFKEYIKACYYGPNPDCEVAKSGSVKTPMDARKFTYFILATIFVRDYPDVEQLLYDEETGVEGQNLFVDAVDFVVDNCLTFKNESGDIIEDYDNFGDGADGKITKVINAIYNNLSESVESLYGEKYNSDLKKHVDTLCDNVTKARLVLSEFFLNTENDYNVSDVVSNISTFIGNIKLIPAEHFDELYLAKARTANRYSEHIYEVTPTTYTVTFDLNGGSENEIYPLEELTVASGSTFTLPERPKLPAIILIESGDNYITVNPPEGKWIDAFEISGERYELGEEITIGSDTVIKCLWKDITYIDKIEFNIEAPIVGTKIEGELNEDGDYYDAETITIRPVITIPDGVDYNFRNGATYWAESGDYHPYVGEIEAGKTYNAYTLFYCEDDSHQFREDGLKVIINGEEIPVYNSSFFVSLYYPMEALTEYAITYDANGGTGTMSGESAKYYIFPSSEFTAPIGKTFDKWEVNGKTYEVGDTLILTEDITVKATWKNKSTSSGGGGSSSSSSYKVTTKIENGTITPANVSVKKNADQEFTFKANEGYEIADVLVDGKSVGTVEGYKLEKVTEKHTIEVKTSKIPAISNVDEWAKEEMDKAEEKGLIPETFAKKDASKAISRLDFAAVAVKLYEAISGIKAIPVANNPFTDTSDTYVLKAYALGITLGTSENTFTPNMEITREQMATMLTRALAKAGINTTMDITNTSRFVDDSDMHDWGRPSIYFMSNSDIIKGVGDNKFNGLGNAKVEEAIAIALRSVEIFAK